MIVEVAFYKVVKVNFSEPRVLNDVVCIPRTLTQPLLWIFAEQPDDDVLSLWRDVLWDLYFSVAILLLARF